jgi:hypothetical protein
VRTEEMGQDSEVEDEHLGFDVVMLDRTLAASLRPNWWTESSRRKGVPPGR